MAGVDAGVGIWMAAVGVGSADARGPAVLEQAVRTNVARTMGARRFTFQQYIARWTRARSTTPGPDHDLVKAAPRSVQGTISGREDGIPHSKALVWSRSSRAAVVEHNPSNAARLHVPDSWPAITFDLAPHSRTVADPSSNGRTRLPTSDPYCDFLSISDSQTALSPLPFWFLFSHISSMHYPPNRRLRHAIARRNLPIRDPTLHILKNPTAHLIGHLALSSRSSLQVAVSHSRVETKDQLRRCVNGASTLLA